MNLDPIILISKSQEFHKTLNKEIEALGFETVQFESIEDFQYKCTFISFYAALLDKTIFTSSPESTRQFLKRLTHCLPTKILSDLDTKFLKEFVEDSSTFPRKRIRKENRIKKKLSFHISNSLSSPPHIKGESINVAASGLYLLTKEPLMLNKSYFFQLPGIHPPQYRMRGIVQWKSQDRESKCWGHGIKLQTRDANYLKLINSGLATD